VQTKLNTPVCERTQEKACQYTCRINILFGAYLSTCKYK